LPGFALSLPYTKMKGSRNRKRNLIFTDHRRVIGAKERILWNGYIIENAIAVN
jgi:hypothetical protein